MWKENGEVLWCSVYVYDPPKLDTEIAHYLETNAYIMAMQRMVPRRGRPALKRSNKRKLLMTCHNMKYSGEGPGTA